MKLILILKKENLYNKTIIYIFSILFIYYLNIQLKCKM